MSLYSKIFCGFYVHMLDVENSGEPKISNYFANSAIFIISVIELFGVAALVLLLDQSSHFKGKWVGVTLVFSFVAANWAFFIFNSRYHSIVNEVIFDENKKRVITKSANIFTGIVAALFLGALVYRISTF